MLIMLFSIEANKYLSDGSVCHIGCSFSTYSIQFKIICIAIFMKQSLQSSFTGNEVSTIDLYIAETIYI